METNEAQLVTAEEPAPDPTQEVIDSADVQGDPRDEFIAELKREIVEKRHKAKRVDDANVRLLAAYAASDGRLLDADLIALSDDLLDDAGIVDPGKVTAAIDTLLTAKPRLQRGPAPSPLPGQGIVTPSPAAPRGLFDIMRGN